MSSTTRNRALAAFFAVTTGALLTIAGPVHATGSARAGDLACWLDADTSVMQCFDGEGAMTDAIVDQTGSVLADPAAGYASRSAGLLAVYPLVRFYADAGYGGDSLTVTSASSTICTTGPGVQNNLTGVWNDRVSSFQSFNSCSTRIWQNAGYTGSWFGYAVNAPGVGALDNAASSFRAQ
jgi:hypothetical protein